MSFYIYLILGFVGGIPAGMGMGGGTLTIPLLTLLGGVEQKIAQSANLFSFLPMSIGALKTHEKNGLLVPIKDEDAMAAGIQCLIEDRELACRLGEEAAKIGEIANGQAIFEQWREYIEDVIAGRG